MHTWLHLMQTCVGSNFQKLSGTNQGSDTSGAVHDLHIYFTKFRIEGHGLSPCLGTVVASVSYSKLLGG